VIGNIVGPQDVILHDTLIHNSVLQGALLSGATRVAFPHDDPVAASGCWPACARATAAPWW